MGPTQGVGEAMAITQGTIMVSSHHLSNTMCQIHWVSKLYIPSHPPLNSQPKLQTITEVVVVAATTGETTTEEGAGVVMATEIAMVRQSCYIY